MTRKTLKQTHPSQNGSFGFEDMLEAAYTVLEQ
jgi:hypothetical protein